MQSLQRETDIALVTRVGPSTYASLEVRQMQMHVDCAASDAERADNRMQSNQIMQFLCRLRGFNTSLTILKRDW
eukprot:SAG31_NODE_3078_length_4708_cov_1.870471_4_plen_74_part_00